MLGFIFNLAQNVVLKFSKIGCKLHKQNASHYTHLYNIYKTHTLHMLIKNKPKTEHNFLHKKHNLSVKSIEETPLCITFTLLLLHQ